MAWEVEYTDQFREWWDNLAEEEQEAVTAAVNVLQRGGRASGGRSWTRSSSRDTRT
jgi:hypothetical protein